MYGVRPFLKLEPRGITPYLFHSLAGMRSRLDFLAKVLLMVFALTDVGRAATIRRMTALAFSNLCSDWTPFLASLLQVS